MAAPPPDIPRNPETNRVMAALVALFALLTLFVAGLLATTNGVALWVALIPTALAAGLFYLAWRLFHRPPRVGSTLTFTDDGFALEITLTFHATRHYNIRWDELREIHDEQAAKNAGGIHFLLTHAGAERLGLVQPTTRADAPDLLVKRRFRTAQQSFALPDDKVIERMAEAAEAAGYQITRKGFRYYFWSSKTFYDVARKG